MSTFSAVKSECDKRNRKQRNVQLKKSMFNPHTFWQKAPLHNFMVVGGMLEKRDDILLAALQQWRQKFQGPIIVLNSSLNFEQILIEAAQQNTLGKVNVSSMKYPSYDLFYGMEKSILCDLFKREYSNADADSFEDYVESFLNIVGVNGCMDWQMIQKASQCNSMQLANLGRQKQLSTMDLNRIQNNVYLSILRRILKKYEIAFQNIQTKMPTHLNISQFNACNRIYVLEVDSSEQRLVNQVLTKELQHLQSDYLLVMNNVFLTQDDPLKEVIVRQKRNGRFGMCCSNLMAYTRIQGIGDVFQDDFPNLIVLNGMNNDTDDLQKTLAKFGTYYHYETSFGLGRKNSMPHFDFGLMNSRNVNMDHYERQRVRVEDMNRFEVAARGDMKNIICLYKTV